MKNNQQLSFFTEEDLKQPIVKQIDAFLYFMSRMEVDMLEFVLDDDKTYEDCTKSIFLEKFSGAVAEIKNAGNDSIIYKRGYCVAKNCNIGCSGYMFLGNKTKHYFNCIVKEENDKIVDIHGCTFFSTIKKHRSNYKKRVDYDIYEEDKVGFEKDVKALINIQHINKAIAEIEEIAKHQFDINSLIYWVNMFDSLYCQTEKDVRFIKKYYDFNNIFCHISSIVKILPLSSKIDKLLIQTNASSIDLDDIDEVANWWDKNRLEENTILYNLCYKTSFNKKKNTYTIKLTDSLIFKLDSNIMKSIFQYYNIICSIPDAQF